jgi:hypothetical protein
MRWVLIHSRTVLSLTIVLSSLLWGEMVGLNAAAEAGYEELKPDLRLKNTYLTTYFMLFYSTCIYQSSRIGCLRIRLNAMDNEVHCPMS